MATSTVKNVMIEFKSFDNDSLRIRLDNPKDTITREQIAVAFQKAFTEGWIICSEGSIAGYIGETILETSTKVSLEGQDFYVTPNAINIPYGETMPTITVMGAVIQGYNVIKGKMPSTSIKSELYPQITNNGLNCALTYDVAADSGGQYPRVWNFTLILVIRGTEVRIPISITDNNS